MLTLSGTIFDLIKRGYNVNFVGNLPQYDGDNDFSITISKNGHYTKVTLPVYFMKQGYESSLIEMLNTAEETLNEHIEKEVNNA